VAARERYAGRIDVVLGMEIDFIPDSAVSAFQRQMLASHGFDYLVGSVHFLGESQPPRSFDGTETGFREILDVDYEGAIEAMVADYYRRLSLVPTVSNV